MKLASQRRHDKLPQRRHNPLFPAKAGTQAFYARAHRISEKA
jgi:hypothetical protein